MNSRQIAALTDPLSSWDVAHLKRCRHIVEAERKTMIIVVLAVDR